MESFNDHPLASDAFSPIVSSGSLTPFWGGASGARHFILKRGTDKFFVKVSRNGVPLKHLLDYLFGIGYSCPECINEQVSDGVICRIYEFIEGLNLDRINVEQYGRIASQVVGDLRLLESLDAERTACLPEISIEQKTEECLSEIDRYFHSFPSPFPYTIDFFRQKACEYAESFKGTISHPIHGDVKIDNFILADGKPYILDDGDLSYGPFAFNFQFSVHQLFLQDENNGHFLRAIINDYYQGEIPKSFQDNLKFLLIKKFFNRYKDKTPERRSGFLTLFEHIFQDIFSNEHITCLSQHPH